MSKLQAYIYKDDIDSFNSTIIYHFTSEGAKRLGVKHVGYDNDFIAIYCRRFPCADKYTHVNSEPYIEKNNSVLRNLGWHYEDESLCDSCGLGALGMDEHHVCYECNQCIECGCDEDCPCVEGHEIKAGGE